MIQLARMMELVDMQDLKSCGPKGPCGFNSHSEYKTCLATLRFDVIFTV